MHCAAPGVAGAKHVCKPQYNHFIDSKWVAPVKGRYSDVVSPVNGNVYTQAARFTEEGVSLAHHSAARRSPFRSVLA